MTSATESAGGEVAVRENGTVTAIDAPSLDGTIAIDLDDDEPHVGVPEAAHVAFESGDDADDADVEDAELATDGGIVQRVGVSQRGVGLGEELAQFAIGGAALSFAGAGYLLGVGQLGTAMFSGFAGCVLTAVLAKERAGGVA